MKTSNALSCVVRISLCALCWLVFSRSVGAQTSLLQQRCNQFAMLSKLRLAQGDHTYSWIRDYPLEDTAGVLIFRDDDRLLHQRNTFSLLSTRWIVSAPLREKIREKTRGDGVCTALDLQSPQNIYHITFAWLQCELSKVNSTIFCYEMHTINHDVPALVGCWAGAAATERVTHDGTGLTTQKEASQQRLIILPITRTTFMGTFDHNRYVSETMDILLQDNRVILKSPDNTIQELSVQFTPTAIIQGHFLLAQPNGWIRQKFHLKRVTD